MQELSVFHALAVPVAAVLLISAYYLYPRRRRRALQLAIVSLLVLAVFNLLKGLDFEEALGDFAVAALLFWGRSSFYVEHEPLGRRAALLRVPLIAALGLIYLAITNAVPACTRTRKWTKPCSRSRSTSATGCPSGPSTQKIGRPPHTVQSMCERLPVQDAGPFGSSG